MDVAGRLPRLRATLEEAGCDALVVTSLTNIAYLTGFTGSAALLLVGPDFSLLTTDGRYRQQSAEELGEAIVDARIEIGPAEEQRLALVAAADGLARIGLEAGSVSWARQRRLADEWFPDSEVVATEGLVEALRRCKDPGELDRMRAAAAIADAALAEVRPHLTAGTSEDELARALDAAVRRLGSPAAAFATIVASGPNAA
ncbi:MAG: aminopeptidase P family protein, partial [Acidimicrobiales bacterium]